MAAGAPGSRKAEKEAGGSSLVLRLVGQNVFTEPHAAASEARKQSLSSGGQLWSSGTAEEGGRLAVGRQDCRGASELPEH